MKFIELLRAIEYFDGEVVTKSWETNYSFVWGKGDEFTEEGKRIFNKILNSEAFINKGNIILTDNSITYEELESFTKSCAGYCSIKNDKEWFIWSYATTNKKTA